MSCPKNVQRPFLPRIQYRCSFEFKCKTVRSIPASLLHLSKSGTHLRQQIFFFLFGVQSGIQGIRDLDRTKNGPKGGDGRCQESWHRPWILDRAVTHPGLGVSREAAAEPEQAVSRDPLTITGGLAPPPGRPCRCGHPPPARRPSEQPGS